MKFVVERIDNGWILTAVFPYGVDGKTFYGTSDEVLEKLKEVVSVIEAKPSGAPEPAQGEIA
jgi:hypothetical protein